ncbi:hypothetical protein ADU59_17530 [Pararhizobium polonicum]|uniref:DUF559 domain-containing protein n=1 Tax=Pararhizobium polonicum TaxID=1612624 RepID=A0A1C7NYY4_9HYPH|nr:endonuclease domain-containing protein [Pararhizobium polonicum]OBZ94211.1 hypothetical protein ADU59_17530 [Pararhizobium polonicum]
MAWNRENPKPPSPTAALNIPRLRKAMTDAEHRFWQALRRELPETQGRHFRRQMAIGRYVADFVCLGERLIIEVDGAVHDDVHQRQRDAERDACLRGENFRVMRVTNKDVILDMPSVLRRIAMALATPTPNPSLQGRVEF